MGAKFNGDGLSRHDGQRDTDNLPLRPKALVDLWVEPWPIGFIMCTQRNVRGYCHKRKPEGITLTC